MTYYQILRQRRLDLKLSIQDVSSQTRLAPQYIEAIELNDLDVFSDDFSFVRYFVHAYCDAIGVNWKAIQSQVDANINAYAHQRNMALTQAQRRMAESMPSAKGKVSRKSRGNFQKRVTRLSRDLNWSKKRLIQTLLLVGGIGFGLLFVVNLGLDYMASQRANQLEMEKEAQLAKKEQETEKLAQQRAMEAKKEDIVINKGDANTYTLTNVLEHSTKLELEITLPLDSTVCVYDNDVLISGDANRIYSDIFKQEIEVKEETMLKIVVGTYSQNEFSINGNHLEFNENYWYFEQPAVMNIIIEKNSQKEEKEDLGQDQDMEAQNEFTE